MSTSSERLVSAFERLGEWLLRLSWWQFVTISLIMFALKSTFFWRGSFFFTEAAAFPKPATAFSSNVLAVVIHKASGPLVSPVLLVMSSVALALAVWLVYRYIKNETADSEAARRFVLLAALSWPGVTAVLPWMGNGTAFLPLFIVIAIFGSRLSVRAIGIAGATLTHPEQALAAFLMLAVLSQFSDFSRFKVAALWGTFFAGIGMLAISLWISSEPIISRGGLLPVNFDVSSRFSLRYGFLGVYTWWSAWWLLVIVAFILLTRRARLALLLVGIAVPGMFAFITDNYTRVFAGVAAAVAVALLWFVATQLFPKDQDAGSITTLRSSLTILTVASLAFLLLPNLHFMMPGEGVPVPGAYWVGIVENYVELGRP